MMEEHVVGDDGAYPRLRRRDSTSWCRRSWSPGRRRIVSARYARSPKISARRRSCGGAGRIRHVRDQHADQALGVEGDVLPAEDAFGLAAAPLAERQQPAQPGVGRPVGRIDQDRRAVGQIEAAADDQPDAGRLGGLVGADDAGEAVAIGDRQRLDAACGGLDEQLLAGTRAAQEGEVRGALQLGIVSCEDTVQEPAKRSRRGILAVAGPEEPEALARFILDLEVIPHRDYLGIAASSIRREYVPVRPRASPGA